MCSASREPPTLGTWLVRWQRGHRLAGASLLQPTAACSSRGMCPPDPDRSRKHPLPPPVQRGTNEQLAEGPQGTGSSSGPLTQPLLLPHRHPELQGAGTGSRQCEGSAPNPAAGPAPHTPASVSPRLPAAKLCVRGERCFWCSRGSISTPAHILSAALDPTSQSTFSRCKIRLPNRANPT